MIYSVDYTELVEKINPIVFSKYLIDTGWKLFQTKRRNIRVFQRESEKFIQVVIPMEDSLYDYKRAMYDACEKVANYEQKPLEQFLLYLLNPNADILKIRIEKKEVEAGSILLNDAIGVYENAKKLLGAAAQDVLKPSIVHKGRMDTVVTDFLSECKFGQTEVGSYIVSIICPMSEVDSDGYRQLELFEEKQEYNFTRQVTEKVFKGIQIVKDRIDSGQYNLAETSEEDGISANFYEALMGINMNDEGTKVEFSSEWAPNIPVSEKVPNKISMSYNYYKPLQATVSQMKGRIKKKSKIVGRIKRLEAAPDVANRKVGKVHIVYLDDNNKAKNVMAMLEKEDYDKAIEAHINGWYVEAVGDITGGRYSEINCESFNVFE